MDGKRRVGERAREETRMARAEKVEVFTETRLEPAIMEAARGGYGHTAVYLHASRDGWLLGPHGETTPLLHHIAHSLGVSISSLCKADVLGESMYVLVLSWEDDIPPSPPPASQSTSDSSSQSHSASPVVSSHHVSESAAKEADPSPKEVPPPPPRKAAVVTRPFVGHYVHYGPTLHTCCKNGDIETLQRLLEHDPNIEINAPDSFGYTPLHHAVSNGLLEHAMLLIQHGATPDAEGMKKLTPLHCAAYSGKTALVRYLAPLVDVNKLDSTGRSPLHWAAERGFQEIVEEICAQSEVLVDVADQFGMTPCKYAAFWGYREIHDFLDAHIS